MSEPSPLKPPERIYASARRIFTTVWSKYERWNNEFFNFEQWEVYHEWFIFLGVTNPVEHGWFFVDSHNFDGHEFTELSCCGLELGFGYSYRSQRVPSQ